MRVETLVQLEQLLVMKADIEAKSIVRNLKNSFTVYLPAGRTYLK